MSKESDENGNIEYALIPGGQYQFNISGPRNHFLGGTNEIFAKTFSSDVQFNSDVYFANDVDFKSNVNITGSLNVNGSNPQILLQEGSTEFVRLGVEATTGDMCLGWDDSDDMHFGVFTSPTDTSIDTKMIIEGSSGDVGIGTASPSRRLHIEDNNASGDVVFIKNNSTATTSQSVLTLQSMRTQGVDSTDTDWLRCLGANGGEYAYIRPKTNGWGARIFAYEVDCNTFTANSKAFQIPHPDPTLKATHKLRHTCIEGPTEGDTIYRWQVDVTDNSHSIILPDYYKFLNKNDMVWISPVDHFGIGHGKVNEDQTSLDIKTNENGLYNVLLIGTRKDNAAVENYLGEVVDNKDIDE